MPQPPTLANRRVDPKSASSEGHSAPMATWLPKWDAIPGVVRQWFSSERQFRFIVASESLSYAVFHTRLIEPYLRNIHSPTSYGEYRRYTRDKRSHFENSRFSQNSPSGKLAATRRLCVARGGNSPNIRETFDLTEPIPARGRVKSPAAPPDPLRGIGSE